MLIKTIRSFLITLSGSPRQTKIYRIYFRCGEHHCGIRRRRRCGICRTPPMTTNHWQSGEGSPCSTADVVRVRLRRWLDGVLHLVEAVVGQRRRWPDSAGAERPRQAALGLAAAVALPVAALRVLAICAPPTHASSNSTQES